jgi:uncharacterized cofD-like protein
MVRGDAVLGDTVAREGGSNPGTRPPVDSSRAPARTPRFVALGGGTGLPAVLKGLKEALFPAGWRWIPSRDRDRLTAIVTVADDGGSSGRLRRAYRVPSPGDIRNCLLALSHERSDAAAVFSFRFNGHDGQELTGHSLGNLILTALAQVESDFSRAVGRAGRILGIRGRVLPATLDDVSLIAEYLDGGRAEGESHIAAARRIIRRVRIRPAGARILPPAREAVAAADLIVIGPGSLYTSLIPVLLIGDLADSIARSSARVALVMNLMAEPGETDGYTPVDVLRAIRRHAPRLRIHDILLNSAPISPDRLEAYARQGAAPIPVDEQGLRALGCRPVRRDLLGPGPLIRHDPERLARVLIELASGSRP